MRIRTDRGVHSAIAAVALLSNALSGTALAATPGSVEEVRECVKANEPPDTAEQTVELQGRDANGDETESEAKIYWKRTETGRSNLMLRFFEPPDMRTAGLLILEEEEEGKSNMWMYLPEIGKARRVSKHMSQGSLFGTDFTYEEFERLYGLMEEKEKKREKANRLEDSTVEQRPVYVLEEFPKKDESEYDRTVLFIDKQTCVALRMEFYEEKELRKVITTPPDRITTIEGRNFAEELRAENLRDGTTSKLTVKRIKLGEPIPRRTFTLRWLETGRR